MVRIHQGAFKERPFFEVGQMAMGGQKGQEGCCSRPVGDDGDDHHANSSLLTARKFEVSPGQSNPFQSLLDVLLKCSSLFNSIHLDEVQIFLVLSHPGDEIRSAVRHPSILKPGPAERLASWIQLPLKPKLPRGCRAEGWRPPRRCRRLASTFGTSNQVLCLGRKELLAKRVALMLTTAAMWFVQSVHASECVTVTSNNDPSRDGVVCKRVARSSMNGIGFWRCCPQTDATND